VEGHQGQRSGRALARNDSGFVARFLASAGANSNIRGLSLRTPVKSAFALACIFLRLLAPFRLPPNDNRAEVRMAPLRFLVRTVTQAQAGLRFAPFRNSTTTPRVIRFAACTKNFTARHATLSLCSRTSARIARIATRIFIAVRWGPTAPNATHPSVGMSRFNRSSSTSTGFRCLVRTLWWNARSVTKAPRSDNTRDFQRLAPPVTWRIFRGPRRLAGAYRITWDQIFSRRLARPAILLTPG
jgi:hypothetical protein